ncbi:MAG: der [Proteobacteria bacterium]|nr:der [Pseudomonadota bacterium]
MSAQPTVALVGRPNVGKSTLFNRLVGKNDLTFQVIDTAGLEEADPESLEGRMRAQTEMAIREADAILFLYDARAGITPLDKHFSDMIRRMDREVILVANKAEGRGLEAGLLEAYELGLGEAIAISAEHGQGMADLYDAVRDALEGRLGFAEPDSEEAVVNLDVDEEGNLVEPQQQRPLRVTVTGRPNAGKSTLINRMIGQDRLLTGPEAGITRDSISVDWVWRDREVKLFDTAGLRRKARVQGKLEKLSVADALRAIKFAEVVVVLLDATIPFEKQDLQIVDLIVREGRALVIGLNKWDLVENHAAKLRELREECERLLPQVRGVELVTLSGLNGQGLDKLMQAVVRAYDIWNTRISTGRLNRWLTGLIEHHPPPAVAGRRLKIRYITQAKTRPPMFIIFGSRPEAMPESYMRYLSNGLRETFEMPGTPIRVQMRSGGDNPYDKKD